MGLETKSVEPPTLDVWIIILGEAVTRENFELCSQAVDKSCVPKSSYLKGETAWRYILSCLLPNFAMRQRHIPRKCWSFSKTKVMEGSGKPYLRLKSDVNASVRIPEAMGFSWAETGSAMAFAHSTGQADVVINIGIGMQLTTPTVSSEAFLQSHLHKLTRYEEKLICADANRAIHRLNIVLAVKDAYLKAMGQPVGFDLSRITCDISTSSIAVDGTSLDGWEFHIFTANLDLHRKNPIKPEELQYLVAVAIFRGGKTTKFFWPTEKEMGFVQFFDVSQIIRDVPRLGEYDEIMPHVQNIPLSTKHSEETLNATSKTHTPTRSKEKPPSSHHRSQQPVVPSVADVKRAFDIYKNQYPSADLKYNPDVKYATDVNYAPPLADVKYNPDMKSDLSSLLPSHPASRMQSRSSSKHSHSHSHTHSRTVPIYSNPNQSDLYNTVR